VRYRVNVLPNGLGTSPAKDAGIPGLNLDNFYTSGLPFFRIRGEKQQRRCARGRTVGYALGANQCNCPLAERETQYQFVSNSTKLVGNHSIKFGADLRFARTSASLQIATAPVSCFFNTGYTGSVPTVGAGTTGGLGLATFLLGQVTNFKRYVSSSTNAQERRRSAFSGMRRTLGV